MFDVQHEIEQIAGLAVHGDIGSRVVEFTSLIVFDDVLRLIQILRRANATITLHDRRYPSPPGAFMDYSQEKAAPERWSMTLGNHGWTGGIYQIDDETIALQIHDVFNRGRRPKLQIEGGTIFSHYDQENATRNKKMIQALRELHKKEA